MDHPKYILTKFLRPRVGIWTHAIKSPKVIKDQLDLHIIGQEHAKKTLAVGIFNLWLRIINTHTETKQRFGDVALDKSNILLLGPTGCGKTYMINTLAKLYNIPFVTTDVTQFTPTGYVGEDVTGVFNKLINRAWETRGEGETIDDTMSRAMYGIVYIDEFDKLASDSTTKSDEKLRGMVQEELLRIIEGKVVELSVGNGAGRSGTNMISATSIDTTNILFIGGGAFPHLAEIIKKRTSKSSIGFKASVEIEDFSEHFNLLETEDLLTFGLKSELVGRFPIRSHLRQLTRHDLISILLDPPESIINQFQHQFKLYGKNLEFDSEALVAIADKALSLKIGARGLRSIIERSLLDAQFDSPTSSDTDIFITAGDIK